MLFEINKGNTYVFNNSEADKHTVSELIDRFEDEYLIHKSRSSQINISQQLIFWKKKFGTKRLSEMQCQRLIATS